MQNDTRSSFRWLVVALYVNAIFWTIPLQRSWSDWLIRNELGRWWLGGIGVAFAVVVLAAALLGRPSARTRVALAGGAAAYAALVWWLSPVPDEVVHVAEYGALALLVWWALPPGTASPWIAAGIAAAVGLADEITQGVTPARVFDPKDVAGNFFAALVPMWVLVVVRGSRAV